jgi:putative ABC transport system permease protein
MGALKMASRNIWRRKARTFLVILALGFSIAILTAIPATTQAYSSSVETAIENQSSAYRSAISMTATEITVGPPQENFGGMPSGSTFGSRGFIGENIAENLADIPGVEAVVPQFQSFVQLPSVGDQENQPFRRMNFMTIVGIPLNSSLDEKYSVQPDNIVEGRKLNEDDNRSILLGVELENYFSVAVGQSVNIGDYSFLVVGFFDAGNRFVNRQAYVSLADAQAMFDQPGEVSQIRVFAGSVEDVNNIVNEIESAYGDSVSVTTQSDLLQRIPGLFQETENAVASQLAQMENVAGQEILIAIVAGGLIVFLTMIYSVRERTKEIGILKALGFTNWNITSQFMLEGAIIGLVGGLVGCLIGSFGAPLLSSVLLPHVSLPTGFSGRFGPPSSQLTAGLTTQVMPDASLILFSLGIAVLLGVVGSLYPSWWASRKRPAEALKYE